VREVISANGMAERVFLSNGEWCDAGIVIMATGVKPEARIAKEAGCELGRESAVRVNAVQQTSVRDIYAAGDCAEVFHLILKRPAYFPLGTVANRQGRAAGENAAGLRTDFAGITGTKILTFLDVEAAVTGITVKQAEEERFDPVSVVIDAETHASYYPGAQPLRIKMIADRNTGCLLGCGIAGGFGAAKKIDVITAALHKKATLREISQMDFGYAPVASRVWDPIAIAAAELERKLR
jgi:NADPH-dependent 2,4-dienoyl-CoA reductase/sulfur reductase-like enzyme